MKAKEKTVVMLRFDTKVQRELVKRAARLEHRSMNNYILRYILAQAGRTVNQYAAGIVEQPIPEALEA